MTTTLTLAQLIAQRKAQFSRQRALKPNPGRNRYRILPGWRKNGDPTFYHDFGQHFIKDATGQVKAVYVCADKTFGRPCEVCDAIEAGIRHAPDDATKKALTDAKASGRVLMNVLHLDGPNPTEPQILEVAPSVFNGKKGVGGILSLFEEWPNLIDPASGTDIIIEKSGTGLDTSYGVSVAGSSKPVPAEALTKLHDIDAYVKQESEAAAARALASIAGVSGMPMLSAPSSGMGVTHAIPASGMMVDEDVTDRIPVAPAVVTPPAAVVAAAVAAPAAAPTAPEVPSTGDPDLDKLLKDLG